MAEIAHVRARTSICNSLFARKNFSRCKQNKEWTKTKRLFDGGEEAPRGLAQ